VPPAGIKKGGRFLGRMYSQKQKSPEISTKSRLCLFLAEGVSFNLLSSVFHSCIFIYIYQ